MPKVAAVQIAAPEHPKGVVWLDLLPPMPTHPDAAMQAVQSLAGLAHHPRLVLEARGRAGRVSWRLGCQASDVRRILATIRAHIPGLLSTTSLDAPASTGTTTSGAARGDVDDSNIQQAASVRIRRHHLASLDVEQIEPVTRSLLSALGQAGRGEELRLQLVLGAHAAPRQPPSPVPPLPPIWSESSPQQVRQDLRRAQAKYDARRFRCILRIGAHLPDRTDPARSRRLIEGVAAALRPLEVPGLRIDLRRESPRKLDRAIVPTAPTTTSWWSRLGRWEWWPLELTTNEVACLLAWPLASDPKTELPAVPPRHPRLLPVPRQIPRAGRVFGDGLSPERPVAQSRPDSLRHTVITAPTGMGKSTLLAQLALQDIEAGHSVVVVDPKSDLALRDILPRIPEHRHDDVVILDPLDPMGVIGMQPLGGTTLAEADLSAETMFGILKGLYPDAFGVMTADVLHAALVTLARHRESDGTGTCLAQVPTLLSNAAYRRRIVAPLAAADPMGIGSFWASFDALSEPLQQQTIAPVLRRLRPILMRPGMRAVFGQRAPRFDLNDVFTQQKILLVPLNKGVLGSEAASLCGSVTLGLLWQHALRRAGVSPERRRPVSIIVDEFADVLRLGTDIADALAQARGLGVSFSIAQQFAGAAPKPLRDAVDANVLTRVCLALSDADARDVAAATSQLEAEDLRSLPAYQGYARILTGGTIAPWCSLTTRPLPAVNSRDAQHRITGICKSSRERYGIAPTAIDADLMHLASAPNRPGHGGTRIGRSRPIADNHDGTREGSTAKDGTVAGDAGGSS